MVKDEESYSFTRTNMRILYSFGPAAFDANPYVHLLLRSVSDDATVHHFNWKFALLGTYDVFHVHWPETLIRRRTVAGRMCARLFLVLLLIKLAALRIPVVRTEHNLRPHETGSHIERLLLSLIDRQAVAWIVMNMGTTNHQPDELYYIPHGHYMDWYTLQKPMTKASGQVLNFGLIRPYKGVESLVAAFGQLPEGLGLRLTIMGKPSSPEAAAALLELTEPNPAVNADLRHIPDQDLTSAVAESVLVVLPYESMHNSGALLLALSLGTCVLVPKNAVTDALAEEVGTDWVQRFDGPLTPENIIDAYMAAEELTGSPDLSAREWPDIGTAHIKAYRKAHEKLRSRSMTQREATEPVT